MGLDLQSQRGRNKIVVQFRIPVMSLWTAVANGREQNLTWSEKCRWGKYSEIVFLKPFINLQLENSFLEKYYIFSDIFNDHPIFNLKFSLFLNLYREKIGLIWEKHFLIQLLLEVIFFCCGFVWGYQIQMCLYKQKLGVTIPQLK